MAGRSGHMFSMGSSIDATQSESFPFFNDAFPNQALTDDAHFQPDFPSLPNYPVHGKRADLQNTCAECLHIFSTNAHLEQHASGSGHTSFSCTCGAQFSRAFTLTRHINSKIGVSFPCELCDDKAFPRLDKLGDHLRRFHRLGGKAFDLYKGGNSPPNPASLPAGGDPQFPAQDLGQYYPGQIYPVAPVSMFNGFPSASTTTPDSPSADPSGSPGSFTVSESWYSQPGDNAAYPS
ncbi:hypothetical protein F5883DRAFT_719468 [Diaporthe sp. PMI_573]|nr:hypothetical protein F5883DRAFT_719468 [Diaporthaceae sp. PMI_573]